MFDRQKEHEHRVVQGNGLLHRVQVGCNDTAVFQLTLRGYNYTGVAAGLGCSANLAIQRVTYARRGLATFIEAQGIEVIAGWYQAMLEQSRRAEQRFIAEYVAAQEKRYRTQYGAEPKRRLREDWKSAARVLWGERTRGGAAERRERVAVAAD